MSKFHILLGMNSRAILSCIILAFLLYIVPARISAEEQIISVQPESIPGHLVIPDRIYEIAGKNDSTAGFPLRIAHATDIHFYSEDFYDPETPIFERFAFNNEGRTVRYLSELLQALKTELLQEKISIMLISGDMTVLGTQRTHRDVARILSDFEKAGIEVYITAGNHDINNPRAFRLTDSGTESADSPGPDEYRRIYRSFGWDQAVMTHDETLSYLAVLDDNYMLLSLDTSYYQDNYWFGTSAVQGIVIPSLYDFASAAMDYAEQEGCRVIVMTHHNFLGHYEIDFDMSNFLINDDGRMMRLLAEKGAALSLSGHIHKTDIKSALVNGRSFTEAALTSFAQYPHSYRLIGLGDDGAGLADFEISPDSLAESRILNYSWYIYYRRNFIDNYQRLLNGNSPADAYAMAEYFYSANLYSQQGLEEYMPDELINSNGADLYAASGSFLKGFAAALPVDSPPSDRGIIIRWAE